MAEKILTNTTRIFQRFPNSAKHIDGLGIWRIMWNGSERRIVLRGIGGLEGFEFLHKFPDGCTLELLRWESGDAKEYDANEVLYRFRTCYYNRRWIRNVTALSPDEMARLDVWLEVKCNILKIYEKD